MPRTKIVATLGPAISGASSLKSMFEAGVNVFRLNASHGTWDDHLTRIASVRAVAAELGAQAGILLDLQGPKIRLGTFEAAGASCSQEVSSASPRRKCWALPLWHPPAIPTSPRT